MSPRGRSISIGALSAVLGLLTGVVGGTVRAMTYTDGVAKKAADAAVEPVRQELHNHMQSVQDALRPGGVMHDFRIRSEERDAYLVDAISALCAANPRANCPAPGRLVSNGNGH